VGHAIGHQGHRISGDRASIRDQAVHACKNLDDPVRDLNFVTSPGPARNPAPPLKILSPSRHNAALVFVRP